MRIVDIEIPNALAQVPCGDAGGGIQLALPFEQLPPPPTRLLESQQYLGQQSTRISQSYPFVGATAMPTSMPSWVTPATVAISVAAAGTAVLLVRRWWKARHAAPDRDHDGLTSAQTQQASPPHREPVVGLPSPVLPIADDSDVDMIDSPVGLGATAVASNTTTTTAATFVPETCARLSAARDRSPPSTFATPRPPPAQQQRLPSLVDDQSFVQFLPSDAAGGSDADRTPPSMPAVAPPLRSAEDIMTDRRWDDAVTQAPLGAINNEWLVVS